MKAKIQGIDDLFDDSVSYRIPQFQRSYKWSKKQWEPLWDDVRKIADSILDQQKDLLPHFMGAIVLQNKVDEKALGEARRVLVVDGQQRLTTLQLLLKATQNAFQEYLIHTRKFDGLGKLLLNDQKRTGGDHRNETKICQSNRLDEAAFQEVIRDRISAFPTAHAITNAYNYFRENVGEWVNRHANVDDRAMALHESLVKHLKMAAIILDTKEKPHVIFEILNTRGEPLKQADLVKNTIMYEANVVDSEQKAKQLWMFDNDDWWWEEDGKGKEPQIRIDRFLNYWIMMRIGKYVKFDRTAAEFRNFIEKFKPDIEEVAQDIKEAGLVYRDIEKIQLHRRHSDPKEAELIKLFLERIIETMGDGVIIPPLLWLYTNDVSEKERRRSARALESYLVRRMCKNIKGGSLNLLFIDMVERLKEQKDQPAGNVVIQFLKEKSEGRIWPNDSSVINYLTISPMPGIAARKRMVFEAIEERVSSKFAEPLVDTKKLTVEHILPKSWAKGNWPLPEDTTNKEIAESIREECIKFIGNLTLASKGLNFAIPNKSWENKKKALHQHSRLYLNKELLDNAPEVWDETAIVKRSEQLAQAIVQIWPHADGI